jgi:GNAT superfamily N-acetyltransferase
MKKILCILATTLLLSCESWLDVNPRSQVKEGELFSDEAGFRNALLGIYNLMGAQSLYGQNLTMGFADVLAQYYYVPQATHGYYPVTKYDYENALTKAFIESIWRSAYNAIANTNNFLAHVDEKGGDFFSDPRYRGILRGEALAARALLHFDLLRMMAPPYATGQNAKAIPYVDKVSRVPFPQLTVGEVVERCLQDLNDAATALYDADPISPHFGEYYEPDLEAPLPGDAVANAGFFLARQERLNYLAVKGLTARVYLYKGDRENAARLASEALQPARVGRVFFEIYNSGTVNMANALFPVSGTVSAASLIMPKERKDEIYEVSLYTSEDSRLMGWFKNATSNAESQIMSKYEAFEQRRSPAVPVLSLEEVSLILAEATDNQDTRYEIMNALRTAVGLGGHPLSTGHDFETELFKEYRKQFVGEGVLFYFMKRKNFRDIPFSNTTVGIDRIYSMLQYLPTAEYEYGLMDN